MKALVGAFNQEKCLNRFLSVKALVGAFNQEKALVSRGLLRDCETDGSFYSTNLSRSCSVAPAPRPGGDARAELADWPHQKI